MENLVMYKQMPVWTAETLPETVKNRHNTKIGTWGKLAIFRGKLKFVELNEDDEVLAEHIFDPNMETPFVEPQVWHRVEALTDDLECQLAFYCQEKDYVAKKYGLTATHSEVVEAVETIKPCKVLDLGCGRGRNSLFLAKRGFDVTAVDQNELSLQILADMAEAEDLDFPIGTYDINQAALTQNYDWIISTVVMMNLDREQIPVIIKNMQEHTTIGGYNLIVCAMDTETHPCSVPFSFTFKEGELKDYYQDWEFIKYNENVGELHKRDSHGNYTKLQFATMLAKKVQ
ncbi:SAM-dependent methyltransferase TehB [Streptococcus massiliensis]|uniref:Tellurite resistance protein TehB n=1 Tax=Streptococcus massiliensis TaxID=313439 RepID=A0A380KZG0_9STRE|nr:SAM-dependent methyltransferase TehB [Streptococcus massiliensis]SUN77383.1 tellurite resistance protein TehB [Streptococcus massiliensis]